MKDDAVSTACDLLIKVMRVFVPWGWALGSQRFFVDPYLRCSPSPTSPKKLVSWGEAYSRSMFFGGLRPGQIFFARYRCRGYRALSVLRCSCQISLPFFLTGSGHAPDKYFLSYSRLFMLLWSLMKQKTYNRPRRAYYFQMGSVAPDPDYPVFLAVYHLDAFAATSRLHPKRLREITGPRSQRLFAYSKSPDTGRREFSYFSIDEAAFERAPAASKLYYIYGLPYMDPPTPEQLDNPPPVQPRPKEGLIPRRKPGPMFFPLIHPDGDIYYVYGLPQFCRSYAFCANSVRRVVAGDSILPQVTKNGIEYHQKTFHDNDPDRGPLVERVARVWAALVPHTYVDSTGVTRECRIQGMKGGFVTRRTAAARWTRATPGDARLGLTLGRRSRLVTVIMGRTFPGRPTDEELAGMGLEWDKIIPPYFRELVKKYELNLAGCGTMPVS